MIFQNNCRSDETLLETTRWPYEEEDLLSYIDNEELPIVLLDLLEAEYSSLFYSGCIIAQIRDYRQAYPSFVCDTHHVLLKPTTQVGRVLIFVVTTLCDVFTDFNIYFIEYYKRCKCNSSCRVMGSRRKTLFRIGCCARDRTTFMFRASSCRRSFSCETTSPASFIGDS